MYPTAIVVLVEMQKSIYDTDEVTRERGFGTASGMVFATHEFNTTQGDATTTRITEHSHRPTGLHSSGDTLKHSTSTKVELEKANASGDSIPGKP